MSITAASTVTSTATSTRIRPLAVIAALMTPIVLGSLACAVIAALIRSVATVPASFGPFYPLSYIQLITFGVIAGMIVWLVVRRLASNSIAVLRILVPAVVLLSFVPDIVVGVTRSLPGTTWPGVIGLMMMHVAVAALAVMSFAKFLPLARRD